MPYKETDRKGRVRWRGVVKRNKRRIAQQLFDRKADAAEWERQTGAAWDRQQKAPDPGATDSTTLIDLCERYLDHAEAAYNWKTYEEKQHVCRLMLKRFGKDTPVDAIDEGGLQDWFDAIRKTSTNKANKIRKNVLAMFNHACRHWKLGHNPAKETLKGAHDVEFGYTPPVEDVEKLMEAATPHEKAFLLAYLKTGARRSEILRWKWDDDIDFNGNRIRLGTRKTTDGSMRYRWLPMASELRQWLQWILDNRTVASEYVFVCEIPGRHYGKPYKFRGKFVQHLCKKAGIRPFGYHALRRHVASKMAAKGTAMVHIREVLGHQSLAVTERYVQRIDDGLRDIMEEI